MDSEDNSLLSSRKKRDRRVWTDEEEDALINILEELVVAGQARKNGTFKHGTSAVKEDVLLIRFPNSGLKYSPHVESKIKDFKKKYALVYDMLQKSGFGWNDVRKCVEVDSDEAWYTYVKHHSDAGGWRGRPFPCYEAFSHIFGVDCAVGTNAKVPAAILDEVNNEPELQEQADPSHFKVDNDLLSTTKSAMESRSEYTSKKRKRENDNIILPRF